MADGPSPEEFQLTIILSETAERQKRDGLSIKDKGLPVRQNIIRVYNHTPELQEIGRVLQRNAEEEMKQVFRQTLDKVEHFYEVGVVVKTDEELLKLTGNPKNKASLKGKTIFMAQSTIKDTPQALMELSHELGAFRLTQIYGSIEGIPVLPAQNGESLLARATHYLDEFVFSNGNTDCLEPLRKL